MLCTELNVVGVDRLYPRALLTPVTDNGTPTEGDERAYTDQAQAVRFGGRDSAAREIWRPAFLAHRADRIRGQVCSVCASARESVGRVSLDGGAGLSRTWTPPARHNEAAMLRARIHDGDPPPLLIYAAVVLNARLSGRTVPAPSEHPWEQLRLSW